VNTDRYAEERRQGELIAREELERVWGWSTPAGRIRAERRARFLIDAAALAPGVRCLELGCGTGEFTARLTQTGCTLVGIELSEATAAIARERVGGRAEIVVGNVETGEGIEGREFDAIVGVSVLHHVDLDACLAHTFTLLRRGGRFAFSEPNLVNPQVWAERNIEVVRRRRHVTRHETAFRASELRRQLEEAGLEVVVCEPFEFLHPSTPRVLIPAVRAAEALAERTALREIAASIRVAGRRPLEHDEGAEGRQPPQSGHERLLRGHHRPVESRRKQLSPREPSREWIGHQREETRLDEP
jgi:SAM-dependent methyltransferase